MQTSLQYAPYTPLASIEAPKLIMILVPHFDDDIEFTGGLVRQCLRLGIKIVFVVFTDGSQGLSPYTEEHGITCEQLTVVRHKEFHTAIDLLTEGSELVQLIHFPYPDMQLTKYASQVESNIKALIELVHPDVIIAPRADDYHPDHCLLGFLAGHISKSTATTLVTHDKQFGKNWIVPAGTGQRYHTFTVQEYFEVLNALNQGQQISYYQGEFLLEISPEEFALKVRALQLYVSQHYKRGDIEKIVNSNKIRGSWIGKPFAETYDVIFGDPNVFLSCFPQGTLFKRRK